VIKAGDKVYRVIVDPWTGRGAKGPTVTSTTVKSASEKLIQLDREFPHGAANRLSGVRFPPKALGAVFHATPAEAVAAFKQDSLEQLKRAHEAVAACELKIGWATVWAPTECEVHDATGEVSSCPT
jgi:hypothetical protein